MVTESERITGSPLKKRKFTVESVIPLAKNTEFAEPVYARFTNGIPVQSGTLKGHLHQNVSNNKHFRNQRLLTVETPWMKYIGDHKSSKDAIYIGVLNKTTGKMKLVETSTFTLRPKVGIMEDKNERLHDLTRQEALEEMVSRFGSKRANQAVRQKKMYSFGTEGMSEAMQQASTDVTVTEENLDSTTQSENDYLSLLPECDREAKKIEEVYKLEVIAPDYFLANYEDTARSYLADKTEVEEKYSKLVCIMISMAKLESNDENQVRLMCLALYVSHLIKFSSMKSRELKKTTALQDCPKEVKHYIFDTFAKGRERILSVESKDRVYCLIIVLAFIGCKYDLTVNTIIESLVIDLKKLHLLMKAIGATYVKDNLSFKLKMPLTKVPKPSNKRMAKGMR